MGTILVDGAGQTLYLFEPDHRSGRSTCYSTCALEWPPLLLPAGVSRARAEGGARASLLGTTTRANGSVQVTYDRWPLYRFAPDESPGGTAGDGLDNLGGRWYVVSPKGDAIL